MANKANVNSKRQSDSKSDVSGVLQMFLVAGGLLLAYHLFVGQPNVAVAQHSGASKGIVVVDSKAVFKSFMEVMEERIASGKEYTEGQLQMSGSDFAAEYLRALKKYRDAGYLVIDKQYALGVPNDSEITREIGEALNMDVVASVDPFSAPALD